ncbi:MAG TPA: transglycosylase domain-containing protein, partial [Actinotalea sp.]|nr:transglycosylase domain-containing protein [Actinotalea sp.]
AQAQTSTVYYADGTTEMGTFGVQNRVILPADEIPQLMKDAVVAAEDRTFYENPGVDPVGILRALYVNLRYGERQGGSSITQQYAERYYHSESITSYTGKLQEAVLAIKLDRQQDKDQIVSNYLNTIYYGRDSYGIETAAQSYFGVSARDLTRSQSALIAGVIPSPNNFDPRVSPEQAERRWNYVMDGMVATGAISQAERDAEAYPQVIEWSRSDTYAGTRGYLLQMVRDEIIAKAGIAEDQLDQRGYSIVTTIDPGLQGMLEQAVAEMPADRAPNLRVAGVTLSPNDGAILGLYGGPDYLTQARNAVTQEGAQAGSTFKPFTLAAYLQ